MTRLSPNRRLLALKLFAVTVLVNALILMLVWPASAEGEQRRAPLADHVEVQIRAQLNLPFEADAAVMLLRSAGAPLGPARLLAVGDQTVTLALPQKIYQQHYRALIHDEWALIPVIQGLEAPVPQPKVSYEIAY